MIAVEIFSRPSSHAPGCHYRLSMLAKANATRRAARRSRSQRAAETRAARLAEADAVDELEAAVAAAAGGRL